MGRFLTNSGMPVEGTVFSDNECPGLLGASVEKVGLGTSTRSSALEQERAMTVYFALSGMMSLGQQSSDL